MAARPALSRTSLALLLRVRREHTCLSWLGWWTTWRPLSQVITRLGQQWCRRVQLWKAPTLETHLRAVWEPAYQDVWFLISDQPAGCQRIGEYAWRTRVEATFQDGKSRGWRLEASFVQDSARVDRLLLGLFLAVWWVCRLAAACLHHGQRHRFDRPDRRDKGIFRLGRLWLLGILRRVLNEGALASCLPFTKRPNGWVFLSASKKYQGERRLGRALPAKWLPPDHFGQDAQVEAPLVAVRLDQGTQRGVER